MLNKLGRQVRPLVCKLGQRYMSSKRNVPIVAPWRSRNMFSDLFRDPWREARDMEHHFDELWRGMERMMMPRYFDGYYTRPRETARSDVLHLKYDSKGFELRLDVREFDPSDLQVKMTGNTLTVSGKHENKADDHGFISREFHRELTIPEDVDLDTMTSSINEEGVLKIRADLKEAEKRAEKTIDIQKEQKEISEKSD